MTYTNSDSTAAAQTDAIASVAKVSTAEIESIATTNPFDQQTAPVPHFGSGGGDYAMHASRIRRDVEGVFGAYVEAVDLVETA